MAAAARSGVSESGQGMFRAQAVTAGKDASSRRGLLRQNRRFYLINFRTGVTPEQETTSSSWIYRIGITAR